MNFECFFIFPEFGLSKKDLQMALAVFSGERFEFEPVVFFVDRRLALKWENPPNKLWHLHGTLIFSNCTRGPAPWN